MEVGRVNVKITGENSSANAAINQTTQNLKNMSPSLNNIESLMKRAFTAGAIIAAGKQVYDLGMKCVELSSRMNEMQNVISTVFKDSANDINKWAEVTGKAMGRSTLQMADFASQAGAVLSGMGKSGSELNMMSEGFAKLAVDIGSFWNVTDIDAFMALRSAISGEMEPMKRFGVVMTEANLSAFALEQGIRKKISAMSEDEKTTLRYNFLLAKTKDSQGDAEKTMGSYANQVKVLDANFKNLGKTLGDALKPMIQAEIEGLNLLIEAWGELAKKQAITKISEGMINPKNFNKASLQDAKEQTETKLKTAYGTDMMKYESILEGINNEIERQNKLEAENAKIKLRKDIIAKDAEIVENNIKKIQEEQRYFSELANEIKNVGIVGKVLDQTIDEINQSKLSVISGEIEALGKAGDTTSDRFKKLRAMWNALVKEMNNSKIDVRIDSSAQYIHPASNVYNAIPNDYTPDEYNPYQYEDFSNIKLSGAGSSGVNMGAYYGGLGYNGMISNAKGTRKSISTGEGSGAVYNEKQSEYYKKLYSDMADELNKATESVGSAFSDLGNKLNNDFLKSLGDTVSGISDLQQSLEAMKNAKSIGGTAGALGTLSAGLGIAGAVIGIGATIYNAIKPVGDKQMSAADKMSEAVQRFRDSIKDSTIQEIDASYKKLSTEKTALESQIPIKETNLENLKKKRHENDREYKNARRNGDTIRMIKEYKQNEEIDKKIKKTKKEIEEIKNSISENISKSQAATQEIKDNLKINWGDFAAGVRGAFNASNLTEFYSQFKQGLSETIKSAMITAFLQTGAMKAAMEDLSATFAKDLELSGYDPTNITNDQIDELNAKADIVFNIGKAGAEMLFPIFDKLGGSANKTAEALTSAANTINSIPTGLKLSLYRYQSIPAKANSWIGTTGYDSNLFPNKPGTTPEMPTVNVYIGSEKITGLVNKVSVTNNRNMWGA